MVPLTPLSEELSEVYSYIIQQVDEFSIQFKRIRITLTQNE